MKLIEAKEIAGTLSNTSKMPCKSTSTSAFDCITGSKLSKIKGSVCDGCYARKGFYRFKNVRASLDKRLKGITHPDWVLAMTTLIGDDQYFRWHDSGDIQSIKHLERICEVAQATPNCRHWLPTKEKGMLKAFIRNGGVIPDNLVVRLSGAMIDAEPPKSYKHTSTVHAVTDGHGHICPAYKQNGECADCRACWNSNVHNVSYPKH